MQILIPMQVQIQKANVYNVYKSKHTMQMQKWRMSKDKYKHAFALSPMELNQGAKISTSVLPFFQIVSQFHYFYSSNSIRTRRRVHSCCTFHLSLDSVADSELYSKRKWAYWRKKNCSNNFTIILPSQTQLSSLERNRLVMDWAKCISIIENIRTNAKWEAKDGVVWICGGISRN